MADPPLPDPLYRGYDAVLAIHSNPLIQLQISISSESHRIPAMFKEHMLYHLKKSLTYNIYYM